jgi:DNA-directed RNA polymerase II subunit RPB2
MLKSSVCRLVGKSAHDLQEMGECIYDQGGYFIINGSEKVRWLLRFSLTAYYFVFR